MTFEKIQAIIVDQLGKEEEEVQLTTRLKDELDADQDLVNYVDKQLAEK